MKLEINHIKRKEKKNNYLETKQHATKKPMVTDEIKEEIKKYLETNDNENTTIQNLWGVAEAVVRGKFIAIQAFPKKTRKISNNLT